MTKMLDPIVHARNEALEEAAKVAEAKKSGDGWERHIALAIRALKTLTED